MKRILITGLGLLSLAHAQFRLTPGTQVSTNPQTYFVLDNMSLFNDNQTPHINGRFRFTGDQPAQITGVYTQRVHSIEINKTAGADLLLQANTIVDGTVNFNGGNLNLYGYTLTLSPSALLLNESEVSRAMSNGNGTIVTTVNLNAPSASNPGNIGAVITSSANLGSVIIRRGHLQQTGSGLNGSIKRWYEVVPANNTALNAALRFQYFDAELNNMPEASLSLFQSTSNGSSWTSTGFDGRDANLNYVSKSGLPSLYRYTLSTAAAGPLPVTGLQFFAKRLNAQQVALDWETVLEIDNKGFYVERRKEFEAAFTSMYFVNSKAPSGSSNSPLNYTALDTNNYRGKTYYRLKQVDINGKWAYSLVRVVNGDLKQGASLKAWPIPAPQEFSVTINGIEKDVILLFDATGRLIKQVPITENEVIKINGLASGSYVIRLKQQPDLVQKVIIQ